MEAAKETKDRRKYNSLDIDQEDFVSKSDHGLLAKT